jgi:MoaA/NifB/PqqE/SkfB family radical SAM enzyme
MGKNTLRFSESKAIPNNDNTFTVSKDVAKALGLEENSKLRVTIKNDRVEILPNIHSLGKLYIEPTSLCNLACSTCIRHAWNEKMGNMSLDLFDHLTNQLSDFKNLRSVMFGGFGEPLFHKDIQYMIQKMNELGLTTEVTTNGTLLDEDMLQGLFSSGLNTLWVSLDGAHLDSYHQASGSYRDVLESLCRLATLNEQTTHPIEIGIAVVVTKGNIQSLPGIINLAESVSKQRSSLYD